MTKTYTVTGMSCDHCEQSVEDAVGELDGVEDAEADNEADTLVVEGEPDDDAVVAAVDEAGYEASA
ncbi:heavy-metal-associated domain-containing protein [Halarchaeum nitratireducens]|uniref:Heavy metal transporter n=1 Tax=Halarchaeum nitratireducens TaxID=489913 RepID=A0A830GAQ2_9EURY|nr:MULTISPECIES: cation transporter [Halarchaeum]MBP2249715.1 copper chaperone CopZ [Halarchaeum solikamskense]GGN11055.1 heavy metal transporter [Halarchaeum nitratireducens]